MSKSRGNVINPDEMIKAVGADALRLYELFMGPFDQMIPWNTDGLMGMKRFLERVWRFFNNPKTSKKSELSEKESLKNSGEPADLDRLTHKTIKKVSEDIEAMKFNTAISALMILLNEIERANGAYSPDDSGNTKTPALTRGCFKNFLKLLAPFAPHITEEIWQGILGNKKSIHKELWPAYDPELINERKFNLIIQVNGKYRGLIRAERGIGQNTAEILAKKDPAALKFLSGKSIKRVIFVEDRLINFVVDK